MSISMTSVPTRCLVSLKNLLFRQLRIMLPIVNFNFEVTRVCNGHCIYCNIWKAKTTEKEITASEIREGLRPLSLFKSVKTIAITGGEVFLKPDLIEIVQALKEVCPNTSLGFVTNGLQPEHILKKMLEIRKIESNIVVGVSIDGFSEEDGKQRGDPLHYELAWRTANLLKSQDFHVGIGSVITPINLASAIKFETYCGSSGFTQGLMTADVNSHYYANDSNENMKRLMLAEKDLPTFKHLCLRGKPNSFKYYYAKYVENPTKQIIPCFSGFNSFFLNSQGKLFPCINLDQPFGSIKESKFKDIWLGKKAKEIRDYIKRGSCYCYTDCEAANSFHSNIFPAIRKNILMKLKR